MKFDIWQVLGAKDASDALKQTLGIDVTDVNKIVKVTTGLDLPKDSNKKSNKKADK